MMLNNLKAFLLRCQKFAESFDNFFITNVTKISLGQWKNLHHPKGEEDHSLIHSWIVSPSISVSSYITIICLDPNSCLPSTLWQTWLNTVNSHQCLVQAIQLLFVFVNVLQYWLLIGICNAPACIQLVVTFLPPENLKSDIHTKGTIKLAFRSLLQSQITVITNQLVPKWLMKWWRRKLPLNILTTHD